MARTNSCTPLTYKPLLIIQKTLLEQTQNLMDVKYTVSILSSKIVLVFRVTQKGCHFVLVIVYSCQRLPRHSILLNFDKFSI